MSAPARTRLSIALTRSDRLALATLLLAGGFVLIWRGAGRTAEAGDDLPINSLRIAMVRERIDPNTASAPSLRRLPRIGPTKAKAIVEYRQEEFRRGVAKPFKVAEHLTKVKGIGPATVSRMAPHLAFPSRESIAEDR